MLLQLLFRCQGFKLPSGVEKQHQKLQVEPKRGPGGSKLTLKCSQQLQSGAQELPSGAQELPSGTQELQNGAQEQPSSAQEPPSWVQDAPKRLQVVPKRRPRGSKWRPRACKLSPKGSLQRQDGKNVEIKLPCRRELDFQGCEGTQNRPKRRQVALGGWFGGQVGGQVALGGQFGGPSGVQVRLGERLDSPPSAPKGGWRRLLGPTWRS